jgi:microcompartment protein CcmL/EutN
MAVKMGLSAIAAVTAEAVIARRTTDAESVIVIKNRYTAIQVTTTTVQLQELSEDKQIDNN